MPPSSNHKHLNLYKVIIIGDTGVGKTCMLSRFVGEGVNKSHISTIGIDFKMKIIDIEGNEVRLQIWDTAGQERYETITTQYYRRAQGIVLVYDISRRVSFANMRKWLKYVTEYAGLDVQKIIVGNKCDLEGQRQVSPEEGEKLAKEYNVPWFETSAYAFINIDEAFTEIARLIHVLNLNNEGSGRRSIDGKPEPVTLSSEENTRSYCPC